MSYKRFINTQTSNNEPKFQSGMSSQQKYHQIVQSVRSTLPITKNKKVKGCPMHPNPSKRCRKCEQILSNQRQQKAQQQSIFVLQQGIPETLKIYVNNPISQISEKMLVAARSTEKLRNKHQQYKTVKQLVNNVSNEQISINCYEKGSNQVTTNFFIYFLKLVKLRPTRQQIIIMMRHNNVNVKILAMLYLRMFAIPEHIYGWLQPKLTEDILINAEMMVSQFAERLLDQDNLNYDGLRFPRLPIKIQNAISEQIKKKVKQPIQYQERSRSRSRQKVNKQISSSSSSQVSSSESSQSEDMSSEIKQKEEKKPNMPSISLDSLRDRIKNMGGQNKNIKEKILEKYKDENKEENEEEGYVQSEDDERYEMG